MGHVYRQKSSKHNSSKQYVETHFLRFHEHASLTLADVKCYNPCIHVQKGVVYMFVGRNEQLNLGFPAADTSPQP